MLDEILQDSWVYQEIQQKGVEIGQEQGMKKGLEQGIEKGQEQTNQKWLASQRAFLISAVENCFPTLLQIAIEISQQVHDPEVLLQASARIFKAQTQAEAEDILAELPEVIES